MWNVLFPGILSVPVPSESRDGSCSAIIFNVECSSLLILVQSELLYWLIAFYDGLLSYRFL